MIWPVLHNQELQESWSRMLSEVPCMAVIEDIDSVFHGRENVVSKEKQALTFDCLLNCLDGIQRANGLFVAVTTNHIERIDEALASPDGEISSRPGRIDRTLYIGNLDEECRLKIARKILHDRIDLQERLVYEGDGDTAAQFQERCSRVALEMLWQGSGSIKDRPSIPKCPVGMETSGNGETWSQNLSTLDTA